MKLECKNCCYFNSTTENEYEHCCFTEWGHSEWEKAPCEYAEDEIFVEDYVKKEYDLEELTDEEFIQLMQDN